MEDDEANVEKPLQRSVSVRSFCCERHFMKERNSNLVKEIER